MTVGSVGFVGGQKNLIKTRSKGIVLEVLGACSNTSGLILTSVGEKSTPVKALFSNTLESLATKYSNRHSIFDGGSDD